MRHIIRRTAGLFAGCLLFLSAEATAAEEQPATPAQDYPEGDPFSQEETVSEPTRRINLSDLKFGRNYTSDGK
mgnify:CR=1 FL=1